MEYKLIDMKIFGDERGKLVSLEGGINIPFDIKRVYYIFDTLPDQERGKHAHKELEQVIVAIDGACQFVLDDGKTMLSPDKPLRATTFKKLPMQSPTTNIQIKKGKRIEKSFIRIYAPFCNIF